MSGGRPWSEARNMATEYGLGYKAVVRLGGAEKLKSMSPEARDLIVGMAKRAMGTRPDKQRVA